MRPHPIIGSGLTGFQKVNGWNFAENGGSEPARVLLREGSGGDIVADIRLAVGESAGESYAEALDLSGESLYVDVVAGEIRGAVYGQ